jgi:hypothetical protein
LPVKLHPGPRPVTGERLVWSGSVDGLGKSALKPVFEPDLEHCPHCCGKLKINAALLERSVIEKILGLGHRRGMSPQPAACVLPVAPAGLAERPQ